MSVRIIAKWLNSIHAECAGGPVTSGVKTFNLRSAQDIIELEEYIANTPKHEERWIDSAELVAEAAIAR